MIIKKAHVNKGEHWMGGNITLSYVKCVGFIFCCGKLSYNGQYGGGVG